MANIDYIIKNESDGDPFAYNKGSGARGLMQITRIGLNDWNNYHPKEKYKPDDLWEPEINVKIGTWMMNERGPQLLKAYRFEDTTTNRLINYNHGIGNMQKWRKKGGGFDRLPDETQGYINKYNLQEKGGSSG